MPFPDLHIPFDIFTTSADPVQEFFEPVLNEAVSYDVAVGYFSSAWIRDAAGGIASLAKNGGHSRWVINPCLTQEDWEMFKNLQAGGQDDYIQEKIKLSMETLEDTLRTDTRVALAWLIKDQILEFRIAVGSVFILLSMRHDEPMFPAPNCPIN